MRALLGSMLERSVTGLDVGTYSAKVVELRARPGEVQVTGRAELVFDRNASPEEREAELRAFLSQEGFQLETVVTAIPGNRLTQRHLRFPFVGKQVAAAVPLELEEELPIPLESMMLTQEMLAQRQPSERTDVLAALAPIEAVRSHIESINSTGCDPAIVEVDGSVLANVVKYVAPDPKPRLILNIGHRHTNVSLVYRGKPLLIRAISVAGQHLTDALASGLGLEPDAAEKHKLENGIFRAGTIHPTVPRVGILLDQLTRETLRSVQALLGDGQAPEAPVEILLVGGSAVLPGLTEYLSERTRLPCRVLRLPRDDEALAPLSTVPCPERYMQALALALRGSSLAATAGNFRYGPFRYTADFAAMGSQLRRAAILFAIVLVLWPVSQLGEYVGAQRRVSLMQDRLAELHEQALPGQPVPRDAMAGLRESLEQTEELANHLGVTGAGASPLELLREISSRIPVDLDVSLEEVKLERYSIRARGVAPDFQSVERMREELSKAPLFRQVAVSNVGSLRRQAGKRFELTIELERQL